MPFIRSISGLRATLGDALTPTIVAEYTAAFAATQPAGAIVVGRDGRPSGAWIQDIVVGTLRSCGREVRVAGMVPTPTVQLLTEKSDAAGGIIITASHNPAPWNGLKFLSSTGVFLDAEQNEALWTAVDSHTFTAAQHQQAGVLVDVNNAIERHVDAILSLPLFNESSRVRISGRALRIVVDAVNCSGSIAVPTLLRRLGVEVIELYCTGTGDFPHTPEPLTENLSDLRAAVVQHSADAGFAVDPDADRLVIIDHRGEAIGEEKSVMLAIECIMRNKNVFSNSGEAIAVVNLSTSRMAVDAAQRHGGRCEFAPVGEINVVKKMQQLKAIVGGEGSGGIIVPACHYGRDSLVGAALCVWLMAHCSAEEWNSLTQGSPYAMIKVKQEVAQRPKEWKTDLSAEEQLAAHLNTEDGIRVDWTDRWVQLRASNTEPIVRIIAEAPTQEQAALLVNRAQSWL